MSVAYITAMNTEEIYKQNQIRSALHEKLTSIGMHPEEVGHVIRDVGALARILMQGGAEVGEGMKKHKWGVPSDESLYGLKK